MIMLLRDLLADAELGLVLLTGADQTHRPVRGFYITDLMDPRRYLDGGELVLSGLAWHSGPDDSERFVAALADAGVAALAAGTARLGDAPADLVDACRRYGVPALQVPLEVSFNTLAERVRGSTSGRELVDAVASGADLDRVLTLAAERLDSACWVISPSGWAVGGDLGRPARDTLIRSFLAGERLPRTVRHGAGSVVLWPVSSASPPAAAWFLAVRGDQREWDDERKAVAAELSTAVALLRTRTDQAREIVSRSVEAILNRLLDGTASPPEVAARLETAGLPTGESLRVASLNLVGPPDSSAREDSGLAVTVLREIAEATGTPAVTVPLRDGASALFVDDEQQLLDLDQRLRPVVSRLEPGLDGRTLALGLSDVSAANGLRGALDEAGHACLLAARRATGLVTAAELTSHQVLLASVPDELRGSYRHRLLGRLTEYDRDHHSDLVHTLRAFLECSGSWSRCAQRLHLHVNTLRYRIRRIEEITGRDLAEFAVRVDFYLALEVDRKPHGDPADG